MSVIKREQTWRLLIKAKRNIEALKSTIVSIFGDNWWAGSSKLLISQMLVCRPIEEALYLYLIWKVSRSNIKIRNQLKKRRCSPRR